MQTFLGRCIGGQQRKQARRLISLEKYGNLTIETPTNSVNVNSTKKVEITMNVTNGINKTAFTKEDIKINVTYIDGNETKVNIIIGKMGKINRFIFTIVCHNRANMVIYFYYQFPEK